MHIDLELVLNNYNFLNPVYTGYNHFMTSYIDETDFNLNDSNNNNVLYNIVNTRTKEIKLNKYHFNDNYVKYECENVILTEFYKTLSHATTKDITTISKIDEDKIKYSLNYNIIHTIGRKINENAYIIVSPFIYYYISKLETFNFNNSSTHAFRCKKVGTLYSSIDVYVDYYIETDMIVLVTNTNKCMTLYYNEDAENISNLYFSLIITNNTEFKNNITVLRDIKEHDPMEKNMLNSNPTDFF